MKKEYFYIFFASIVTLLLGLKIGTNTKTPCLAPVQELTLLGNELNRAIDHWKSYQGECYPCCAFLCNKVDKHIYKIRKTEKRKNLLAEVEYIIWLCNNKQASIDDVLTIESNIEKLGIPVKEFGISEYQLEKFRKNAQKKS